MYNNIKQVENIDFHVMNCSCKYSIVETGYNI